MTILYQDDDLVVFNKPSGMLTHRGWDNDPVVAMTVVRDLVGSWVYPVHRLDRGASGALLFALSSEVAGAMGKALSGHEIKKCYWAIVRGVPTESGCIDHPLAKEKGGEKREAQTEFRRLGSHGRYSLVECQPRTGRLHQIRRHMKHIACPLIGDVRYGKGEHNRIFRDEHNLHRLALHCVWLEFVHPKTGELLKVTAPLADDFAGALRNSGLAVETPP